METQGVADLQAQLDEMFEEDLQLRGDLLADRVPLEEVNRRLSERDKQLTELEQEFDRRVANGEC